MKALVKVLGVLGVYLVKRYLPELIFDAVIEAAEKAAKSTTTQVDDDMVAKLKADKKTILAFFK